MSVKDIVVDHWAKFGRNYYCRYDYENCDATNADQLMKRLNEKMAEFDGETDNFTYTDPVDGVVTRN